MGFGCWLGNERDNKACARTGGGLSGTEEERKEAQGQAAWANERETWHVDKNRTGGGLRWAWADGCRGVGRGVVSLIAGNKEGGTHRAGRGGLRHWHWGRGRV
jgi:hypothetical protein